MPDKVEVPRARTSLLPASLPPRGLSRAQAAEYVGLGTTKFDALVADGRMPKPARIDGRNIWDRVKLDEAFAELTDAAEEAHSTNEWDQL
jgi:predicted DNA-binding transcriptional regulator AlpA